MTTLGAWGALILTVLFTVYGQLVLKWQLAKAGAAPEAFGDRLLFLLKVMFLNPWVLSGFTAGFLAGLCWMAALTKLELSTAYPFMSLSFVLVVLASAVAMHEALSGLKIMGLLLIMLGLATLSRG